QSFKGAKNDSSDFILSERVVPAHPKGSKTHTDQPPKSEMKRRALDSNGNRGKIEIPQAQPRKLDFLPVESKCPKRKGTVQIFTAIPIL
ncbi:hypothetical protein, partial [Rossellomorea marisflavi]|uniref:hypothetical protein n=1 Tax=Rossellomorea marisflavi TaxID=189381 RepID=UPI003458F5F3